MSDIKAKEEKFVLETGDVLNFHFHLSIRYRFSFLLTENFEMLKALYEFQAVYPKTIRLHALSLPRNFVKLMKSIIIVSKRGIFLFSIKLQQGREIGGKSLMSEGTLDLFHQTTLKS